MRDHEYNMGVVERWRVFLACPVTSDHKKCDSIEMATSCLQCHADRGEGWADLILGLFAAYRGRTRCDWKAEGF